MASCDLIKKNMLIISLTSIYTTFWIMIQI